MFFSLNNNSFFICTHFCLVHVTICHIIKDWHYRLEVSYLKKTNCQPNSLEGCKAWTWRQFSYSCFALASCDEVSQTNLKFHQRHFFTFIQEDIECGVCTSGSSCERGWGAKVNPTTLNVELGPRQPGVSLFCSLQKIPLNRRRKDLYAYGMEVFWFY